MEMDNLIWGASGFLVGIFTGIKIWHKLYRPDMSELARLVSYHRSVYLKVLQRELANFLIRKDPNRFFKLYKKIYEESKSIKKADMDILKAKLRLLAEKYPQYSDFDLISVRDYVLYSDALGCPVEDIEQRYSDILIFQAIQSRIISDWPCFIASDEELEHLKGYVCRVVNTKLKQKLKNAISDFYIFRKDGETEMDTREFSIRPVNHVAEERYGIHLKDSNEFGLYGYFCFDDGRIHQSYYRSDAMFEKEECLDFNDLLVDEAI